MKLSKVRKNDKVHDTEKDEDLYIHVQSEENELVVQDEKNEDTDIKTEKGGTVHVSENEEYIRVLAKNEENELVVQSKDDEVDLMPNDEIILNAMAEDVLVNTETEVDPEVQQETYSISKTTVNVKFVSCRQEDECQHEGRRKAGRCKARL